MDLKYIIEICVGIGVAIFGIAYPILITEINKIGEKFNSDYLPIIFRLEGISKEINLKFFQKRVKPSVFELVLVTTFISFLFLIADAEPWFGWDNIIINNSAKLIVLFLTILLIVCFLLWISKVVLYNGRPVELLKYLIKKFEKIENETEKKDDFLRAINDFTYYTIKNQDIHLQTELLYFYTKVFYKHRENYLKKIDELKKAEDKKKELEEKENIGFLPFTKLLVFYFKEFKKYISTYLKKIDELKKAENKKKKLEEKESGDLKDKKEENIGFLPFTKLLMFYFKEFKKYISTYLKKIDELEKLEDKKKEDIDESIDLFSNYFPKEPSSKDLQKKGVEYPSVLYDLIYRINLEIGNHNNYLTKSLEHKAVSGVWLLGEKISELTYLNLWSVLKLNLDREENIKAYWKNAKQYIDDRFRSDFNFLPPQKKQEEEKEKEKQEKKDRFLEFNYMLGGLLLQQKKYDVLYYLFSYSPFHPLLPQSIHDIFYWFEKFGDDLTGKIEIHFPFPGLKNLGVSYKVKFWICSYISLLYIRKFSLGWSYQNNIDMPNFPTKQYELSNMLERIPFFRDCLESILSNEELLKKVGLKKTVEEKKDEIKEHLKKIEKAGKDKLKQIQEEKELSPSKIDSFKKKTIETLQNGLGLYTNNKINILLDYDESLNYDKKLYSAVNGLRSIISKYDFMDDDRGISNFDISYAEEIVEHRIMKYIPESFSFAQTKKYLVSKENIVSTLTKVLNGKSEKDDILIIGFKIDYRLHELMKNSKFKILYTPSTSYFKNTFFVLHKDDLPRIYKKDISKEEKEENKAELISEKLKVYASVIELNKNEALKNFWINSGRKEELKGEPKVQVAILFIWLLLWKTDRKIIQITVSDSGIEQGIENKIEDIKPI